MTLTITLDLDNSAFGETLGERADEVSRILGEYLPRLTDTETLEVNLRDVNGSTVGEMVIRDDPAPSARRIAALEGMLRDVLRHDEALKQGFRISPSLTRRIRSVLNS